jgi:hypothetical protein
MEIFMGELHRGLSTLGLIDKSIQGLVQVFGITPAANSHQGQQPGVMKSIQSHGGVQKAAQLRDGVVQNVR